MSWFADALDNVATFLNLPEIGLSESWNGGEKTTNTGRVAYNPGVSKVADVLGANTGISLGAPAEARDAMFTKAMTPASSLGSSTGGGSAPAGGTSTATVINPNDNATAATARAGQLRGDITALANNIKDIFNSRYGQVDASATEQASKLNDRFGNESQDITDQVNNENQKVGAAAAATGSYDSSYRGNNVDTVTKSGENQARDLGTELQDNLNKIAQWVETQKSGFDANKQGIDQIIARLANETDAGNLSTIRNTLEGRIADLRTTSADNNTASQNASTLEKIAPSSARAQQLKTTLSSIIGGNADAAQKSAIARKLVSSAGLSGADSQQLLDAFDNELAGSNDKEKQLA